MKNKFFRVICRGMKSSYGFSYIIMSDATHAYEKVKTNLNKWNLGYSSDIEMESVELIAEDVHFLDVVLFYIFRKEEKKYVDKF